MNYLPLDRRLVQSVVEIAQTAADEILKVYESDFAVSHKDDRSPLTQADLAAQAAIVAGLGTLEHEIPILSEESAVTPFSERSTWQRYWLVDPLDGTREFVKRNGEFTVNIALVDGHEPVLGVVFVPVTGVAFFAARGLGAFRQVPGEEPTPIRVRRRPEGRTAVVGSRSHSNEETARFIERLGDAEVVSIGSSLKLCLVAEGRADVYPRLGPTSEWDTAAAQCVVEEAGGQVTDTALHPLRYNARESLLNPHFLVFGDSSVDWGAYMGTQD